jgi:opacity protein-like surface antigen
MKAHLLAASALLLAAPMAASAQDMPRGIESGEGVLGIGVGNYNKDLGDVTNSGFAWGARLGVNAFRYFGAEANFQHLSGGIATIVPQGGVPITSPGNYSQSSITGDLLAGYPIMVKEHELRPYALAGLGYANLSTTQLANSLGLEDNNGLAIPLGVGTKYMITDVLMADARFTYNILTGNKGPLAANGDSWILGINLGARFGGSKP